VTEYVKKTGYDQRFSTVYFCRTYDGAEIDLAEERNVKFNTFEFKRKSKRKVKLPVSFADKYNVEKFKVVSP